MDEKRKVSRMVHAIKMGWMKPRGDAPPKEDVPMEEARGSFYMLWKTDEQPEDSKRVSTIPAPKMKLPGHAESYNPPPEYLMTDKEKERWDEHRYDHCTQNHWRLQNLDLPGG